MSELTYLAEENQRKLEDYERMRYENTQLRQEVRSLERKLKAITVTRCCETLKDLKGNEIKIKSLSDLKKMYPKGTTFSVAGNGKELNYYVDGEITYTRTL